MRANLTFTRLNGKNDHPLQGRLGLENAPDRTLLVGDDALACVIFLRFTLEVGLINSAGMIWLDSGVTAVMFLPTGAG